VALFIPSQVAIVLTMVPTLPAACGAVHPGDCLDNTGPRSDALIPHASACVRCCLCTKKHEPMWS